MLARHGSDNPELEARWIMAHVLMIKPDHILLHLRDVLNRVHKDRFVGAIYERCAGKPVSHIVGGRWFYNRWFHVTPHVLDPRPETETLVATALKTPFHRVLDLGTGSGCILVTLLAERQAATGVGIDVSSSALMVAAQNAHDLGVENRCAFQMSDWFSNITKRFDLIVANPPYIDAADYDTLSPIVRDWEPKIALTPGGDGLDAYRIICRQAPEYLEMNGRLIVEIAPNQGRMVAAFFKTAGFVDVKIDHDMNTKDRVISGRYIDRNDIQNL